MDLSASDARAQRRTTDDDLATSIPEVDVEQVSLDNTSSIDTTNENQSGDGSTPSWRPSGYTVDAMVGQVNGQPIYAATVFEPIGDQLTALGKRLPLSEFRQRAGQLIESRLGQIVADALILGEAESDLSAQEQAGLQNILKQRRQELIRFWGRGSVAVAEENLVRQTSKSLEDTLTEARQRMLVQRYLQQKLFPQINVTRKDIERYYIDHSNEFNPPPVRTIRLIYVADVADANEIDALLSDGETFQAAASLPFNRYRSGDGGLMSEPAVGDQVFGQPELNKAMLTLRSGEHSQRTPIDDRYWWVFVESIKQEQSQSITEVQLKIEALLRRQQFQALSQRYRQRLFETGSYNPIDQMARGLLDVAISRYAAVQ